VASKEKNEPYIDNPFKDLIDVQFDTKNIDEFVCEKTQLLRVSGIAKTFENCNFKYCNIDDCYFRNCKFINCDFTGSQFKNSSFRGSQFVGCKFDYSRFSNTKITNTILDNNQPGFENVALEFAQSLRVNFGQIGDVKGVNKAINSELRATKIHLHKGAFSPESWYRDKYHGWERARYIYDYFVFSFLQLIWGNGESLRNIFCSMVFVILLATSISVFKGNEFVPTLVIAIQTFFGSAKDQLGASLDIFLIFSRFILLGMFVSVLVKRLSRR
jgi:hypothetical protein